MRAQPFGNSRNLPRGARSPAQRYRNANFLPRPAGQLQKRRFLARPVAPIASMLISYRRGWTGCRDARFSSQLMLGPNTLATCCGGPVVFCRRRLTRLRKQHALAGVDLASYRNALSRHRRLIWLRASIARRDCQLGRRGLGAFPRLAGRGALSACSWIVGGR